MFFPISPRPPRGIICNLDFAKINLLFSCICTSSKKIKSPYHSRLYHYNTDRKYRKTKCLCIEKKKSHGSANPNHKTSFPFAIILTCLFILISILLFLLTFISVFSFLLLLAPSVGFADTFPVFGEGLHSLYFAF